MSRAAAIGEARRVGGFALAGVEVLEAENPDAAGEALVSLDPEVGLLILSPAAHRAVADELARRPHLVWTVLPDGAGSTEPPRSGGA
jgi:vacuolar-type H+-ATPase subunit F/Vma7